MRVLLFNLATDLDDPVLGFTTYWIRAIAARVEQVHVITMRAGRVDVPGNVHVHSVGGELGLSEARRALHFYSLLFHVIVRHRIDVCFCHMIPVFAVMASPILRPRGIPIVTWYTHRQLTSTLRIAHHASARVVSSAPSSYPYRHDRLVVTGHGIDTDLFVPDGTAPDTPPFVLSVGRLSPIKDGSTLIEAIGHLRARGHELRCVFVGDAPGHHRDHAAALRHRASALALLPHVEFAGSVRNPEVATWYRRCFAHVNLSPSGLWDKAALEAMACGRPSLVANEEFRDTLGYHSHALVFAHGNARDLATRIEALLRMPPSELQEMGSHLRAVVVAQHSLDN